MLKLRIEKLINRLKLIESKIPGLILNVLNNKELELYISETAKKNELENINQIINALSALTNNSEQEVKNIVCNKFSKSYEPLISTSAYGRIIGIDAKPIIFEFLTNNDLITKVQKKYQLTEKGIKYGGYLYTETNEKYIGWRKTELDLITKNLKDNIRENLLRNFDFQLYHMTHISNLKGIFKNGLMSHNQVERYVDISNYNVNNRRDRKDNPHKISLHQYVPLYFNPRNAMLYTCQKQYREDIVILGIDNRVISNDYTLFSEGNAARKDSKITTNKLDLISFKWPKINSLVWSDENNIVNEELKSLMMSECLIFNWLHPKYISKIICSNEHVRTFLLQQSLYNVDIEVNKNLFF